MANSAVQVRFWYKIVLSVIYLCGLLLLPAISLAQDEGGPDCGGIDPIDGNCPLDTWVIVLVFIAAIFAACWLHRKQKALIKRQKGLIKF